MDICHQILSIMNNALRNILVPAFGAQVHPLLLSMYLVLKVLGHRVYASSILVDNIKQFSKAVTLTYTPINI